MDLEQAMAKIKELEAKIAELEKGKSQDEAADKAGTEEMADMKKKLGDAEMKCNELENKIKQAEQTNTFNKMLAEGRAVEAQRNAFMAGNMVKFAELSKPVNMGAAGTESTGGANQAKSAQDKVLELAEKVSKEKKISLSEGISQVLMSDKDLRVQYEKEVAVG